MKTSYLHDAPQANENNPVLSHCNETSANENKEGSQ